MIKEILFDGRHKFVYFEENKREILKEECLNSKINFDRSIPVYVKDNGLSKENSLLDLDIYRMILFHERYYEFLIGLSVVDVLCNNISKDELNIKLKRIFKALSSYSKKNINNIDDFRYILEHDKNIYMEGYNEYIETGNLGFYDKLILGYVVLDIFLKNIKRALDIGGCFCLLYDYDDLSVRNMMIINKYINSRSNGYLTINVLCGEKEWGSCYDSNGYIIQNIHDYTEIDYSDVKKKIRHN